MNTQIIAIANQKGGVGKTTTCANLGIGLAQAGKKVLLIDGDPQGSLTISLGHPQPDKLPFTLSDAMGRILMDEPLRPGEGILHHPEGVDLMPADIQLSGMEVSLVNAMSRETILRQYLDTLKGQYSHTSGQSVRKLVGAPLVVSLGLLQSGIVEYLVKLDHHLFNVGRLKAAPLHRGDDVPSAGIVAPRLGEQGRQFWIIVHRAFPSFLIN